jgi:hypothetical protein
MVQVETLRDKISVLSRELADHKPDDAARSARTKAPVANAVDAQGLQEMQQLRKELSEAQAALAAQVSMVHSFSQIFLQAERQKEGQEPE